MSLDFQAIPASNPTVLPPEKEFTPEQLQQQGLLPPDPAPATPEAPDKYAELLAKLEASQKANEESAKRLEALVAAQLAPKVAEVTDEQFDSELLTDVLDSPTRAFEKFLARKEAKEKAAKEAKAAEAAKTNAELLRLAPGMAKLKGEKDQKALDDWLAADATRQALYDLSGERNDYIARAVVMNQFLKDYAASKVADGVDPTAAAQTLKSAAGSAAPNSTTSAKTFSRAAIRFMKINQPEQFAAIAREVELAYAEGRVTE